MIDQSVEKERKFVGSERTAFGEEKIRTALHCTARGICDVVGSAVYE